MFGTHWSGESKLTMTFKAVKTLKHGPRSVELNKFLAFLQFFFQANYRVVLKSGVTKYLKLFVNIPNSFSCFIAFQVRMRRRLLQIEKLFSKEFPLKKLGPEHGTISSEGTFKIQNTCW